MEGFKITCLKCGCEQIINKDNIRNFLNVYAWKQFNFELNEMKIAAFVTEDTGNETVLCECGNKVD